MPPPALSFASRPVPQRRRAGPGQPCWRAALPPRWDVLPRPCRTRREKAVLGGGGRVFLRVALASAVRLLPERASLPHLKVRFVGWKGEGWGLCALCVARDVFLESPG